MLQRLRQPSSWIGYLGLGIGLVLISLLLRSLDVERSMQLIASIGPLSVLILVPYLLLHSVETLAWARLFPAGLSPVALPPLFRIQLVSETLSMTLPAGVAVGEPLRPWLCHRIMHLPLPASVAAVAVRKLLLGAAQGIYTLIGALAGFSFLQALSSSMLPFAGLGWLIAASGIAVFALFLLLLLLLFNGRAASSLHNLLLRVPFLKLRRWLLERQGGFSQTDRELASYSASSLGPLVESFLLYVIAWGMLAVESYLILRLLGVHISFTDVLAIDVTLAMLRALFFFIPSGLGVQDLGYLAFFQAAGIADPLLYGGAFILLRRFKEVVWYAIGYVVMAVSGIRPREAEPVQGEP